MASFFEYYQVILMFMLIKIQAEWVEIPQKSMTTTTNKPKNSIRVLKESEVELLYGEGQTTPSTAWLEYQRERFGQHQNHHSHHHQNQHHYQNHQNVENSNSQKLIVTSGNNLKTSVKIIVPAIEAPKPISAPPLKHQIVQTKTRIDVVNNKAKDETNLGTQATTKREMGNAAANVEEGEEEEEEEFDYIEVEEEVHPGEDFVNPINADNEIKAPSWEGFVEFLKNVRKNWMKYSGLSIDAKIQILKNLRDRLLYTIEKRFMAIWKPEEVRQSRDKRGILDESNFNLPPEAALMTLNFLTFAVFLIKLVLHVIHVIKSKHYNITGLGVNGGSAVRN